jgi:hypothetical protein
MFGVERRHQTPVIFGLPYCFSGCHVFFSGPVLMICKQVKKNMVLFQAIQFFLVPVYAQYIICILLIPKHLQCGARCCADGICVASEFLKT